MTLRALRRPSRRQVATVCFLSVLAFCAPIALTGAMQQRPRDSDNRPGEIPLGEWTGRGVFIYQHWDSEDDSPIDDVFNTDDDIIDLLEDDSAAGMRGGVLHRRYTTRLEVWDEEWDDRDVIVMEIRSRRGKLAELGDETHLMLVFEEARRLTRMTVLYRMISMTFNPEPDSEPVLKDDATPVTASCTTSDDVTVLQIHYMDNFIDTLRFEGRRVEKTGMYHTRDGMVHWNEELKQR